MENNIKFRNHISVIFEKVVKTAGIAIFIFAANFITELSDIPSLRAIVVFLAVAFVCILLAFVWHYIIWARTYISIQDNALVIERNTLNRKKNTIGLPNISNINLEQNLFQMALGTCKLKLDTNSLTTANQTDVDIVLKKNDAERFRAYLLGMSETEKEQTKDVVKGKSFAATSKEIFSHGLFSMNLVSVLVVLGVVGSIFLFVDENRNVEAQTVFESIVSILVIIWILGGMLWKIVREFIKYLEFSIERRDDKVYLEYGIIKRVTYSIPVDKINAIRLNQTMIARIGKRYMAEVVNVGMGNDEEEQHSFFLPYSKREKIEEQLNVLLPEFEIDLGIEGEKQPKTAFVVWIANGLMWVSSIALLAMAAGEFWDFSSLFVIVGIAVVAVFIIMFRVTSYITDYTVVGKKLLKISHGHFSKYSIFVKYDKVQFLTMKQCIVAKKYGIVKGQIHLLASAKNQIHHIPYLQEETMKELCEYIR